MKYEYLVIREPSYGTLEKRLNALGAEAWYYVEKLDDNFYLLEREVIVRR